MNYDEAVSTIRRWRTYLAAGVNLNSGREQLDIDLHYLEGYITQADIARRADRDGTKILHDTIAEERARANAAEKERDAAIQYMRKMFGWCTGCVHFTGIYGSGCKIGKMSTCGEENSHYVFGKEE